MKTYLQKLLIVILLFSCSRNEKREVTTELPTAERVKLPTAYLNKKKGDFKQKLSHLIDSTFVMPLETRKECLVGHIEKVEFFDGSFFVLDLRSSNTLFEFSEKGRFIRKFGAKGKGQGEYTNLLDFAIDSKNKEILLYDRGKNVLLRFNRKGKFLSEESMEILFSEIEILGDKYILNTYNQRQKNKKNSKKFSVTYSNFRSEVKDLKIKSQYKLGNLIALGGLRKTSQGELFFREPYSNIIYKLNKLNTFPYLNIEVDGEKIPRDYFEKELQDLNLFNEKLKENGFEYIQDFYVANNWIILLLRKKEYGIKYLYDNNSKKVFNLSQIENDFEGLGVSGPGVGSYKDFFITTVTPDYLKENIEKYKSEKIKNLINSLEISDNPILNFNRFRINK